MLQMILQILNMILHLAQGADIDKYLQHASTFAKHMHGVQIKSSLCPSNKL